jgi:hypothetical protein
VLQTLIKVIEFGEGAVGIKNQKHGGSLVDSVKQLGGLSTGFGYGPDRLAPPFPVAVRRGRCFKLMQ